MGLLWVSYGEVYGTPRGNPYGAEGPFAHGIYMGRI
jgi:hypothetical protein